MTKLAKSKKASLKNSKFIKQTVNLKKLFLNSIEIIDKNLNEVYIWPFSPKNFIPYINLKQKDWKEKFIQENNFIKDKWRLYTISPYN